MKAYFDRRKSANRMCDAGHVWFVLRQWPMFESHANLINTINGVIIVWIVSLWRSLVIICRAFLFLFSFLWFYCAHQMQISFWNQTNITSSMMIVYVLDKIFQLTVGFSSCPTCNTNKQLNWNARRHFGGNGCRRMKWANDTIDLMLVVGQNDLFAFSNRQMDDSL